MGNMLSLKYYDIKDYSTCKMINEIALSKKDMNIDDNIKNIIYSFINEKYVNTEGKIFKSEDGNIFYLNTKFYE
jgi:hypothetical protein